MLPIKEIEEFVKSETKNVDSIAHDFGHLKRTAIGARWFVKILNGDKKEQDLAYIAGLLHDIVRAPTDKISHIKNGVEKTRKILEQFKLEKTVTNKIIEAIKMHGEPGIQKDVLQQSVFLADKILEAMGAYVVFRRAIYHAESSDFSGMSLEEATIYHYTWRMKKFNPSVFHKKFSKLITYQYYWPLHFLNAFKRKEEWALYLERVGYEYGSKKLPIEELIKNFEPKFKEDEKYKKEALFYIQGKKFEEFEKMI